MTTSYDKSPEISIAGWNDAVWQGYRNIRCVLQGTLRKQDRAVLVIEASPTVRLDEIVRFLVDPLQPQRIVYAEDAALHKDEMELLLRRYLTDDRVFGFMCPFEPEELFEPLAIDRMRHEIAQQRGLTIVLGFGSSLIAEADILVYADLSRWETQLRYRSGEFGNWHADNRSEDILRKYKRGYFVEWRIVDRLKRRLLPQVDYYLDTHQKDDPRMISGDALRDGMRQTAQRPFRLVPYFDPGVWGGQWLAAHMQLPPMPHPYAWGFDGVPEENSLYLRYGDTRIEVPAINLVYTQPQALLGDRVYARFGAEFPIRFDFLDTIGGQPLSLQVHPNTDYIQQQFGMHYTQDESYYILDATEHAAMYLGLAEDVDKASLVRDLQAAQDGHLSFPVDRYIHRLPVKKHDHLSIPAGTVHCADRGCMILEISATPYIFTCKLWDWDRVGLDGKPRPVHLRHGVSNIEWTRTQRWVRRELVEQTRMIATGDGWREEYTGLHPTEFIETRRHWFTQPVHHTSTGSVHVMNLVEGPEAIVESPTGAFEPFPVHYAETWIVPASISAYTVRPVNTQSNPLATITAYVR